MESICSAIQAYELGDQYENGYSYKMPIVFYPRYGFLIPPPPFHDAPDMQTS